jgi:hypothetical protein
MKRLATILSDLIPLALTVIFVIAVVLTFSHVTHDSAAAVREGAARTEVACPSASAAKAAQSENFNEAARSGELDLYNASQIP